MLGDVGYTYKLYHRTAMDPRSLMVSTADPALLRDSYLLTNHHIEPSVQKIPRMEDWLYTLCILHECGRSSRACQATVSEPSLAFLSKIKTSKAWF